MTFESISVTIPAPITEHCRDCDYEQSRAFGSVLYKCPKCGSTNMSRGERKEEQPLSVWCSHGSYNLMAPSEKQYQYTFNNTPDGKRYSFVVDEELDTDCPIDLAVELKAIYDGYVYSGSKEKIDALVALIDTDEYREKHEMLVVKQERKRLMRELYENIHTYGDLDIEI